MEMGLKLKIHDPIGDVKGAALTKPLSTLKLWLSELGYLS